MAFNELTAAESERLAILGEELGEAQQAVGKILRHGYESYNPDEIAGRSNRSNLQRELGDVMCVLDMLVAADDLSRTSIEARRTEKSEKIKKYLHHQKSAKQL
jgi:NTP pyrophosphatase (non-canonical NTP hydrolase)